MVINTTNGLLVFPKIVPQRTGSPVLNAHNSVVCIKCLIRDVRAQLQHFASIVDRKKYYDSTRHFV